MSHIVSLTSIFITMDRWITWQINKYILICVVDSSFVYLSQQRLKVNPDIIISIKNTNTTEHKYNDTGKNPAFKIPFK